MANKTTSKQKNNENAEQKYQKKLVGKLCYLAKHIANSESSFEIEEFELTNEINELLKNDRDDVLHDAIDACRRESFETHETILHFTRFEASNPLISINNGEEVMQASLFVVPLLTTGEGPLCGSDKNENKISNKCLESVIKNIRDAVPAQKGSLVVLQPYLYSQQELTDISYLQIYRLPSHLLRAAKNVPVQPDQLLQTSARNTDERNVVSVRYLLGMVVDTIENDYQIHDMQHDEKKQTVLRSEIYNSLIKNEPGNDATKRLKVLPMFPFFDGVAYGILRAHTETLMNEITEALNESGMTSLALDTVTSWNKDEKENLFLQIGIASRINGNLLACHSFSLESIASLVGSAYAGMMVANEINKLGTASVITIKGVRPVTYCGCGEKLYFTQDENLAHVQRVRHSEYANDVPKIIH
jgi:hypothetical protein